MRMANLDREGKEGVEASGFHIKRNRRGSE